MSLCQQRAAGQRFTPNEVPNGMPDYAQRFLFDDTDIRGETVSLGDSYRAVVNNHAYPPAVARLLG